jgi:hypothetical protein
MFSYYYQQSDMGRTILFVFFKKDLYDGHLWFSSLPEAKR